VAAGKVDLDAVDLADAHLTDEDRAEATPRMQRPHPLERRACSTMREPWMLRRKLVPPARAILSNRRFNSAFLAESNCGCSQHRWRQKAILLPPFFSVNRNDCNAKPRGGVAGDFDCVAKTNNTLNRIEAEIDVNRNSC
jgi:hypothetical protein